MTVDRVMSQSKITDQHSGSAEGCVVEGVGIIGSGIESLELMSTSRTLYQCPLVVEQALKKTYRRIASEREVG